jgi:DNA mismatch endonuclease (patch repair protein)
VKSNSAYWSEKVRSNRARDKRVQSELKRSGWKVLTLWECETAQDSKLRKLLKKILAADIVKGVNSSRKAALRPERVTEMLIR